MGVLTRKDVGRGLTVGATPPRGPADHGVRSRIVHSIHRTTKLFGVDRAPNRQRVISGQETNEARKILDPTPVLCDPSVVTRRCLSPGHLHTKKMYEYLAIRTILRILLWAADAEVDLLRSRIRLAAG